MNNIQKQYLNSVRSELPYAARKKYLADLTCSVNAYAEDHPNTALEDFHTVFGSPKAIVDAYWEQMNTKQRHRLLSSRARFLTIIVLTALFTAAIVLSCIHLSRRIDSFEEGKYIEVITEGDFVPDENALEVH